MENNEENKIAEENAEGTVQTNQSQEQNIIEDNRKGLSIASLVLGIISILFLREFIIAVACGVLAIIFGIKGKKRSGKGMAAAGFITGIIGVSLQAILVVFGLILGAALVGFLI